MAAPTSSESCRLLVATEFAPRSSGGGTVLVRQMLQGWPTDRLWWWSCLPSLPGREGQAVVEHFRAPLPTRLYPAHRYARLRAWLMEHLWAPYAAAHLRQAIRTCRPDVIWVIPQQWSIPPLARALLSTDVPLHVSMHDFPDLRNVVERLGPGVAQRLAQGADALYRAARSRDVISAPMLADLRTRTGVAGPINRLGIEPEDLEFLAQKQPRPMTEIRLVFAGTIVAEPAFAFLMQALSGIRDRLPLPLRLEFFGAHSQAAKPWFDAAWMSERRNVPDAEFRLALRECAWGVAPVSLADEDPRYHRFSFPAKISSYLGAGLPVLALGHPASSLVELTRRTEIGFCSTQTELAGLQRELLVALTAEDPWQRFGPNILRCVREEFDAAAMRARLHGEWVRAGSRT